MITVNQIKLNISHSEDDLTDKLIKTLRIGRSELLKYEIFKRSIDSRDQSDICYVYSVEVKVKDEKKVLAKNSRNRNIILSKRVEYVFPYLSHKKQDSIQKCDEKNRPVIVGAGPSGLLCAYELSLAGLCPIILERGKAIDERMKDVENFWETGNLDVRSNVQFGEGGAGTFSDGKLNTRIKDPRGIARHVLKLFTENGADESILYDYHPHIGTDVLSKVIVNIRQRIIENGGEFKFDTTMTGFTCNDSGIDSVITDKGVIPASNVILCIGHSARDTFLMLADAGVEIKEKPFACGLRIIHPQSLINKNMYGVTASAKLPSADYKLTHKCKNGRGVYSFCMCPGGFVVNASSEEKRLAVNGMSYSKRDGAFANSALIVTVTPDDFKDYEVRGVPAVLNGMNFQRALEEKAFKLCNGKIPVEFYGSFKSDVLGKDNHKLRQNVNGEAEDISGTEYIFGTEDISDAEVISCTEDLSDRVKGRYNFGTVSNILPGELNDCLVEAIESFADQIKGFNDDKALLLGVESRTSSPIRIVRGDDMQSNIIGLFPCGEGAGYAGGIMSAAVDGIKTAEKVCENLYM